MKIRWDYCVCIILYLVILAPLWSGDCLRAEAKRAISPSDCVTVRRLVSDSFRSGLQIDPSGQRVAYLVNSPNLATNNNDVELYVAAMDGTHAPKRLLVARRMSGLHWLANGQTLSMLADRQGRVELLEIDLRTSRVSTLFGLAQNIAEYSMDGLGKTLVYAIERHTYHRPGSQASDAETAAGYRIPFQEPTKPNFYTRDLFFVRKRGSGWTKPKRLAVRLPGVRSATDSFPYNLSLMLSVSPDGKYLAFNYLASAAMLPPDWLHSPVVGGMMNNGIGVGMVTAVLRLQDEATLLPFPSPWSQSIPLWSPDSQSFAAVAESPVNSSWERDDVQKHGPLPDNFHLFEVHVPTGKVRLIREDLHGMLRGPLKWESSGELLVQDQPDSIVSMREDSDVWKEVSSRRVPLRGSVNQLAASQDAMIADAESPDVPPSLFLFRIGWRGPRLLANLDPQFDHLTLAPTREVSWTTAQGFEAKGLLFFPPNYDPSRRYPLVIHTYAATPGFFCDSGASHYPAFAPQPIANAGMLYLIRIHSGSRKTDAEQSHYPPGFPGNLGEAAFQTDIWDKAVEALTARGLVDPAKVGIIGFSRSGWYTEFALTHGRTRYAAATVVDNVEYSMGEYWLSHTPQLQRGWDAMYGGSPYSEAANNWRGHSISFNLPKIHTPLLMEVMGYGTRYTDGSAPPLSLALKWEVFSGLSRLHKPTELYYYPLEMHQPDHPLARLGSLERNLAWYLFWLKGEERTDPTDPDRYSRWRAMQAGEDPATHGVGTNVTAR
ncbi:alpha/beta hydrolase family protein [Terriglobus albidus]|uniref:alpha/beta hydrolase family protein n=1 Tax=Terriglobus albidus TaxID=1592106 RepID=UPI0021DFC98D|nr:prolyl oligopeptidase family serine peptidase [Terriglobus albidus]